MLISKKLFFLAFFSILALFVVGGTGIYSATQEANALKNLSERSVPGLHLMHSIRSTQQQIALVLFRHLQTSDPKVKSDLENNMEKLAGDLQKDFANYESKIRTDKGRELYAAEKVKLTEYLEMLSKYLAVLRSGGTATDLSGPMGGKRAELAKLLDEHLELNIATATKEAQTATVAASRSVVISIIMIVLALLVIGWISFSVIQSIRRSLEEIQRTMAMVEGSLDFKARAKVLGHDEIAMVSAGLNRLLDKLSSSFSSIARHTHSISRSSSDMASSAEQVARASTSQSDAASAMAAGVEEMTVSINHISDRSTEARELTTRSGDLARNGVKVINETVEDIGAIAQSVNHVSARIRELETHGNRISTIVSVIKDVAEQTNLLALNAAIEAARAGEQGRGFAVVADEVRKLAERTSGSTLEISSMVDAIRAVSIDASSSMVDAVQMVEAGVQRAGVAREAIQQINLGSTESLRMVEEIACAIQEQSEASTNIAAHVERIAQMAEESSAAAKHSAETAFGLDTLAREMQSEISNYKL